MPELDDCSFDKFAWHKAYGEQRDVPYAARGVAYIMFDHARGDGTEARPGLDLIMEKTGLSESSARRHLRANVRAGWLVLVSSGSNSGRAAVASVYRLAYPQEHRSHTAELPTVNDKKIGHTRQEHHSPVAETPVTSDPLTEPGTGFRTDPLPPMHCERESVAQSEETVPSPQPQDVTPPWQAWEGNSYQFGSRWGPYIGEQISREDYRTELDRRKAQDAAERAEADRQGTSDYLARLQWLSDGRRIAITRDAERKGMPPKELKRLAQSCLPQREPKATNREGLFAYKVRQWTEADVKVSKNWEEIGG